MGASQREKGKRGEREAAALLRGIGYTDAHRTAQYCGNTGQADDVIGVDGLHIEVKRCETMRLPDWMKQATADCTDSDKIPVVMHRRNGEPWYVTLPAIDFFQLYKEAHDD